MTTPIYLDYHATTPVLPEVLEAMLPFFTEMFGNAASRSHAYGWQALEAVDLARKQVADLVHVESKDVYFTSGSTEGLNFAIKSMADALSAKGKHIISVKTEHPAVLDPLLWLKKKGFEITLLEVDKDGQIDPEKVQQSIRPDTILAAFMWANNETGVIHPMQEMGRICKSKGVILVSDATQAAGKIVVDPQANDVDIITLSGHKMYGPKGIGAMYVNRDLLRYKPEPLLHGGGHEHGLRSGTLNVPGIVGLGAAAHHRTKHLAEEQARLQALQDRFEKGILDQIEAVQVNGGAVRRLPSVSNIMVRFVDSQAVMSSFRHQLAISSGSACSSANPEPSHVLRAMGLSDAAAKASFRFSFGAMTMEEQVDRALGILLAAIEKYRSESPVWQMYKQGLDVSAW